MPRRFALGGKRVEDGYRGSEIKDHGIERARSSVAAGCKELQVSLEQQGQKGQKWSGLEN